METNSNKNQSIKGRFVNIHVTACATEMISTFMETEKREEIMELFYSSQDIETALEYLFNDLSEDDIKEIYENYDIEHYTELPEDYQRDLLSSNNIEADFIEPYEFWIVSDYLAEELQDKGYIVDEFAGFNIWGRCTTGQAILLDHCISEICMEMGILEGQSNEWKIN